MTVKSVNYEMNDNEFWLDCGSGNNLESIRETLKEITTSSTLLKNVEYN